MKQEAATISIIIPLYNAERTIERCLGSVTRQTYSNLEIILVDDGSTDRSPDICDRYAEKDTRIRVAHQPNAGVGAARNAGMSVMHGDYLFFLGADDYIFPETIATLYAEARSTESGITIGNARVSTGNDRFSEVPSFSYQSVTAEKQAIPQVRYELFYDPGYGVPVWNKLYRSGFLKRYAITFERQPTLSEDRLFNTQCFIHHPVIQLVNRYTYVYCTEASTITRSKIQAPIEKSLRVVKSMQDSFESIQGLSEFEDLLAWLVFGLINQVARNFTIHHDHAFKEIRDFLVAYKQNETVSRCLRAMASGKYLEGIARPSWVRYARYLSRMLNRGAYTAAASLLFLRFKIEARRRRIE